MLATRLSFATASARSLPDWMCGSEERRARAAIRHVRQVDLRRVLEGLADEMAEAADARRAVVELAGIIPRIFDEFRHGLCRHRGVDRHRVRHGGDLAHEREVLEGVV